MIDRYFRCGTLAALAAAVFGISPAALAQATPERISKPGQYRGYAAASYDGHAMTSQYVAVRDGTRLAVDIFRPTRAGQLVDEKLPVLWMHTPYNRRTYRDGLTVENYPGKALQLAKYGYVIAVVDFRGLYASFGQNRAFNRGEWLDAARFDAYDITEWLARQRWSSGKVGMWGCSATGGSQMQALSTAPPSLKAVFPMSCEWDVYPFVASGGVTPSAGTPTMQMRGGAREARDRTAAPVDGDESRMLLNAAIAEHASNVETAGYAPFRDSIAENFKEQWWLKSSPHTYADTIRRSKIGVYAAANWDEGGTKYGAPFIFNNLTNPRKLILGPGTHCDWTTVLKETGFDLIVEEHRFFDYWLKDIDNGVMREAPVTYYTYNQPPEKAWQTAKSWPLPNERRTAYFLSSQSLGPRRNKDAGSTAVTVDHDVTNENFFQKGLVFLTEPLASDVQITGHPVLKLWIESSSSDADIIARLDDVAPDGSHRYYFVEGRLRASLRKLGKAPYDALGLPWHSFTKDSVQPLEPGVAVPVELDLFPISYLFEQGHRIRLTLNFADARATPRQTPAARVTIHHGADEPSALTLPVIR